MQTYLSILLLILTSLSFTTTHAEPIKILSWEGYVSPQDINTVNGILKNKGYKHQLEVIQPWAEGPHQMYSLLKNNKADISFLTLNYINQKAGKIARLLQPINTNSPRLTNYKYLLPELTGISMGTVNNEVLYIPWGGGAYGIWANMNKLNNNQLPHKVADLWDRKWFGKLSLSKGQTEPNIALASLALGKKPFYLNHHTIPSRELYKMTSADSSIQQKVNGLYQQVGAFWEASPTFSDDLLLVASYGFGAAQANKEGGNWKLIDFEDGNTVWLDTINFHKNLSGTKLEAAEIFANYLIGKKVQQKMVNQLGMVGVTNELISNPMLQDNPNFFKNELLWPPYNKKVSMVLRKLSKQAMRNRKELLRSIN